MPAGWLAFGDMQQVFRGHAPQQGDAPGLKAEEAHYGFTGRPPEQAPVCWLLTLHEMHWSVENRNHHSRGVSIRVEMLKIAHPPP